MNLSPSNKPTLVMMRHWSLIFILYLTVSCCQDRGVSVNLSLHTTDYERQYYVKATITNHTSDDIYVPYLRDFISIYRNEADITQYAYIQSRYDYDEYGYSQDEEDRLLIFNAPDTLALSRNDMSWLELEKQELANFCKMNSIDTIGMSEEERSRILKEMGGFLTFFCPKYDGITLKAGETREIFQPVHMLFYNGKPRGEFEIKFARHNFFESALYDTTKTVNGYKLFCGLPDSVGAYKVYMGNLRCKDKIVIKGMQ